MDFEDIHIGVAIFPFDWTLDAWYDDPPATAGIKLGPIMLTVGW